MYSEEKVLGGLLGALGILIIAAAGWIIYKNYIHGNKQFVDMKTRFNTAYVLGDDGKFERCRISNWCDYPQSDSVQVVLENGTAIYTHLCNVKLTNE